LEYGSIPELEYDDWVEDKKSTYRWNSEQNVELTNTLRNFFEFLLSIAEYGHSRSYDYHTKSRIFLLYFKTVKFNSSITVKSILQRPITI